MKAFVTGATGFLGSYIVDNLVKEGDEIFVLVRKNSDISYLKRYKNINYIYGDLHDKELLFNGLKGIDVVYHSAAKVTDWGEKKEFYKVNFLGSKNILEASIKANVKRFVYISSPSVVFDYTNQINIDESYPYPKKYANYYSETKGEAEKIILASNNVNGMKTVALRPHAVWGPRDMKGFLPRLINKIIKGKMRIIGKTDPIVDLCYVENAAYASILAGKKENIEGGKAYFITDGKALKVWEEFIDGLCKLFNLKKPEKYINENLALAVATIIDFIWKIPYFAKNYEPLVTRYALGMATKSTTYSIEAAKKDLGYEPKITHDEGLKKLKEWIDEIGGIKNFIKYVE